jgi:hypothetical protein
MYLTIYSPLINFSNSSLFLILHPSSVWTGPYNLLNIFQIQVSCLHLVLIMSRFYSHVTITTPSAFTCNIFGPISFLVY